MVWCGECGVVWCGVWRVSVKSVEKGPGRLHFNGYSVLELHLAFNDITRQYLEDVSRVEQLVGSGIDS